MVENLDLAAAVERRKLPVHIRHANLVEIDQRQRPDARAGQRLNRPRPHAAHADDTDMRLAKRPPFASKTLARTGCVLYGKVSFR